MIKSKNDYKYFMEADRVAIGIVIKPGLTMWIKNFFIPNHIWNFQRCLRKLEYYKNCKKNIWQFIVYSLVLYKHNKLSVKLGFSIPPNVFGPGLSIAHYGTIVINGSTRIGANCRIHSCVNIGTEAGYSNKAPEIGNNCYIGPGAKIYGDIKIADGIAIGANSVVNKSFKEENIAIAGVPAKRISSVDTFNFITPAIQIIELGENYNDSLISMPARDIYEKIKPYLIKKRFFK